MPADGDHTATVRKHAGNILAEVAAGVQLQHRSVVTMLGSCRHYPPLGKAKDQWLLG